MSEELVVSQEITGGITAVGEWARTLVVRTAGGYESALSRTKEVKAYRARIVEFFAEPKKKSHEAWKSIVAREKAFTDRLDAIESDAKRAMLAWQRAEAERAAKEQERLRLIAEEQARKEREKLMAQAARAEEKGKADKAESLASQAAAVQAIVPIVETQIPVVKGTGTVKSWAVHDADKTVLIKAAATDPNLQVYLLVDEKALKRVAVATEGKISIPGVTWEQVETMRIGK